jgi:hypothetical protein
MNVKSRTELKTRCVVDEGETECKVTKTEETKLTRLQVLRAFLDLSQKKRAEQSEA